MARITQKTSTTRSHSTNYILGGLGLNAEACLNEENEMNFYPYQIDAINRLRTGSILCGGVGSGKSLTSLGYYYIQQGGKLDDRIKHVDNAKDLYIITTARKRDSLEWEKELINFNMSSLHPDKNSFNNKIVIDSWNNIKKYVGVKDAFFIFDEQRVVGYGAWTKSFIKITRVNEWILLSATPGDTWSDYIPVFIANGFYRNKTHFNEEHVVYNYRSSYPKIDRYINTGRLIRLRNIILVDMDYERKTERINEDIWVPYDIHAYKDLQKNRWNYEKEEPIANASELCYALRKIINSDESRAIAVKQLVNLKHKVIIFYNFDYELEILKNIDYGEDVVIAEWNGHKHEEIPGLYSKWVYLVQYTAGAEGWNCILTDTIIFYSQNYSYKMMEQSSGRIDRLNTPFSKLYYYHIKSRSPLDLAIARALKAKKKFNEGNFIGGL